MTYSWSEKPQDYWGYWPADDGYVPACIGQTRDSDHLAESNFEAARKLLEATAEEHGGEVLVHTANHWACGWVESLWVSDSTPLVREVVAIQEALESYPVLDEEDYSRREYEGYCETLDDAIRDAISTVEADLAVELDSMMTAAVHEWAGDEGQWSRAEDISWSAVEEIVREFSYSAIWEVAHAEYEYLYPALSPGQLQLQLQLTPQV